jgi:hypothetical protein
MTRAGFDQFLIRPVDLAKIRTMLAAISGRRNDQLAN